MNLQLVYQYILKKKLKKKWKYVLQKTKQKDQKNKERKFPTARVKPWTIDVRSERVIYWATTANIEYFR